jgi:hypothetical protein
MKRTFLYLAIAALFLGIGNPREAAASTYEFDYQTSGTGLFGFTSSETLNIGGSCPASGCGPISVLVSIGPVIGPAFDVTSQSGWSATVNASLSDGVDPALMVFASDQNGSGTRHPIEGGTFFASISPSVLDLSTSAMLQSLGGSTSLNYSVFVSLPDGLAITPLPSSLALMATTFGLAGAFWWRAKRRRISPNRCRISIG